MFWPRTGALRPDAVALHFEGEDLRYPELVHRCERLAGQARLGCACRRQGGLQRQVLAQMAVSE